MTRSLDNLHPEERDDFINHATLSCAYKKDMVQHNVTSVKALGQQWHQFMPTANPNKPVVRGEMQTVACLANSFFAERQSSASLQTSGQVLA
jgi:hypothetical protein